MFSKEYKVMRLENRIALLEGRSGKENGKIVQKLKRQLRKLASETV